MTRGRRFFAQVALLLGLYLLSLPDPLLFTNVIIVIAFVAIPINAAVAGVLIWSSRQAPEIETLRERADDAVTLLLMSFATGGTAVFSILQRIGFTFPGRPVLALLSWLVILIAIPAISWLGTWRSLWLPEIRRRLSPRDSDPADTGDA